jgi:hypothetical protein
MNPIGFFFGIHNPRLTKLLQAIVATRIIGFAIVVPAILLVTILIFSICVLPSYIFG